MHLYDPTIDAALYSERAAEYFRLAETTTIAQLKDDYRRMAKLCGEIATGQQKIAEVRERIGAAERAARR